jgi:DNA repair exonuclease SbcCD ATPase subunit
MELANQQWVNTNERLAEVRNSWVAIKQKTDETETTLQSAWRLRTAEIARLRRELGTLESDLEAASRDQAALDVLGAVAAVPDSDQPQFDALLAQVVALNDEHRAYEAGIAQVAELMGVTRGICEGLTRMRESVDGVKKEQDMHSELARLTLRAPVEALRFHDLWDQLAPLVRDEKKAAQHPAQFAGHVRQAIGERLSKDAIDVMFTQLGEELNRATKEQWG